MIEDKLEVTCFIKDYNLFQNLKKNKNNQFLLKINRSLSKNKMTEDKQKIFNSNISSLTQLTIGQSCKLICFEELQQLQELKNGICLKQLSLNLSSKSIGVEYAIQIASYISSLENLSELKINLSTNQIESQGAKAFGESLQKFQNLKQLCLYVSFNQIKSEGLASIAEGISKMKSLEQLTLSANQNQIKEFYQLGNSIEKLANINFLHLSLAQNSINSEGIQQLCKGISKCSHIKSLILQLQNNALADEGILNLSNWLQKCQKIVHLNLDLTNNSVNEQGALHLANLIQELKCLTHLSINLQQRNFKTILLIFFKNQQNSAQWSFILDWKYQQNQNVIDQLISEFIQQPNLYIRNPQLIFINFAIQQTQITRFKFRKKLESDIKYLIQFQKLRVVIISQIKYFVKRIQHILQKEIYQPLFSSLQKISTNLITKMKARHHITQNAKQNFYLFNSICILKKIFINTQNIFYFLFNLLFQISEEIIIQEVIKISYYLIKSKQVIKSIYQFQWITYQEGQRQQSYLNLSFFQLFKNQHFFQNNYFFIFLTPTIYNIMIIIPLTKFYQNIHIM
ncbi:transmembrane protein, putative (macronuclear) [Tetrahymena thermophila SB210]|uniref:Transmembrane protein, putative n=1 Tax=Tetrahymena thermophila (strain SB210) TaxID=312017 RepID=Q24I01_TETTS|nr:transmembrane protein, putative [Tetrahymena thermophila SB210]EAS07437.2 transmembrane protein, putative [Tetrahymena thermophila SB210]|eukprot:XP_001027679.2 transmembrane protein, putative [Tetrahymena thermophila SB210]